LQQQAKPTQASPLHTSSFEPTALYHSTPAPTIISSTTPQYQTPITVSSTTGPFSKDSTEYRDEFSHSTPAPPAKNIYHQVTTINPISHNSIKPTTFSPEKYYDAYKYIKIKDSPRYYSQIKQEPKIVTHLEPVKIEAPPTPQFVSIQSTAVEPIEEPVNEEYQLSVKPLPDLGESSLGDILRKLQESNHLPKTLTPDNIDNSIRTLVKILNNLKASQVTRIPEHNQVHVPQPNDDYDYSEYDSHSPEVIQTGEPGPNTGLFFENIVVIVYFIDFIFNIGRPGIDFPIYNEIPQTNFSCKEQRYKGFFGDPESGCQVS
jgi:hypothetical protein